MLDHPAGDAGQACIASGRFGVRMPEKLLQQPLGHTAPDRISREAVLRAPAEGNVRESDGW